MKTRLLEESDSLPKHIVATVNWYDGAAKRQMHAYTALKAIQLIVAAAIPVVSLVTPFKGSRETDAILGSVILITEGMQQTFQYYTLWIKYRTAYQLLMREVDLYRELAGRYASAESPRRELVERAETIIAGENSLWLETKETQNKKTAAA
jgi:hypothetical protein